MNTPATKAKRITIRLWKLAAIALLLVAAFPSTRWVLREQFSVVALNVNTRGNSTRPFDNAERLAADNPSSYPLRLALALGPNGHDHNGLGRQDQYHRLIDLRREFPYSPSLIATILGYSRLQEVKLPWPELINGPKPLSNQANGPEDEGSDTLGAKLTSEETSEFAELIGEGERLDPANSLFPYYRARLMLATGRTEEALEAVVHAGNCSKWNSFQQDELEGRWEIAERQNGHLGAMKALAISNTVLSPLSTAKVQSAQAIANEAARLEIAGNASSALRIRLALLRYGALMRAQERSMIHSLVGALIVNVAQATVGGYQSAMRKSALASATTQSHDMEPTRAFLQQTRQVAGAPTARWVESEQGQVNRLKSMASKMFIGDQLENQMINLVGLWSAATLLLSNALVFAVIAGLAFGATRFKRRNGVRIARFAMVCGGLFAFWAYTNGLLHSLDNSVGWSLGTVSSDGTYYASRVFAKCAFIGAAALPALLIGGSGLLSAFWRVPIANGIGRTARGLALNFSAILVLGSCLLAVVTARVDSGCKQEWMDQARAENRVRSAAIGEVWSNTVPPLPQWSANP